MIKRPAVFFDRDGIVNRRPTEKRYVESRQEFHILPAFIEALRLVKSRGFAVFIVTNQRGVGCGIMTREALDDIHAFLLQALAESTLTLDGIAVCTADDDTHPDRKPNPGLILGAAAEHTLDLEQSWMIGDTESDILAGRRAGCRTILVAPEKAITSAPDYQVPDMDSLVPLLWERLPIVAAGS